jgi:hypothetical protein
MNKILFSFLMGSLLLASSATYNGSTIAPVVIAGSIVKSSGVEIVKKYNRKDCPVCKGTGKYLSGDGIKMVDCGYCEETKGEVLSNHADSETSKKSPFCRCVDCKCENCQCKPRNVIVTPK